MNKIVVSLVVLVSFVTQGQNNSIKSGIYKNDTSFILINMFDETCMFFEYSGDTISFHDTLNIIHADESIIIARKYCKDRDRNEGLKNNVESRVRECHPYSNVRMDIKKKGGKLLLWNRGVLYKRYRDWDPTKELNLEEYLE